MTDRRGFLKRSGAALSAAALTSCEPGAGNADVRPGLDTGQLGALAEVVLPSELGPAGLARAVADFEAWLDAYEPVAELNHGYGTSEIRYSPPHPGPGWAAQLEGLDLEARQRHDAGFGELSVAERRALVESHLRDQNGGLPNPLNATHVAVALMAHYFASADATDRCYASRIAKQTCRGLADTSIPPAPLDTQGPA